MGSSTALILIISAKAFSVGATQPAARDLRVTAHSKVNGHLVQLGAVPVVRLARLLDRALPIAIAGLVLVEVVLALEGALVV